MTTMTRTRATRHRQDVPVDVKVVISGLWIAMLMVFAYVDLFGFFRADVLDAALEGEVASTGLAVNQAFLSGALLYILLPCLMVVLSLILKPRLNRILNIVLSLVYVVSIVVSCIGETWIYYLVGSAVEIVLLLAIAWRAWTWPPADDRYPQSR
ncbi:MAG: DUF6326 family protein [Ornithinimicrobium sp.]